MIYVVEEGQDVAFMIQLTGQAAIDVQIDFQTADSTATGKLRHQVTIITIIRHLSYSLYLFGF